MKIRIDTRKKIENVSNTFGIFPQRNSGLHQGWDLEAAPGTTIFAISRGKVVDVRFNGTSGDYGKSVTLEFEFRGKKLYAFYAHLQSISPGIAKNREVAEGQELGTTGTSGNASGIRRGEEHLHFEIRTIAAIPKGFGLMYRLDPGELLGYSVYSCRSTPVVSTDPFTTPLFQTPGEPATPLNGTTGNSQIQRPGTPPSRIILP